MLLVKYMKFSFDSDSRISFSDMPILVFASVKIQKVFNNVMTFCYFWD